jgi:hypothetical protein
MVVAISSRGLQSVMNSCCSGGKRVLRAPGRFKHASEYSAAMALCKATRGPQPKTGFSPRPLPDQVLV